MIYLYYYFFQSWHEKKGFVNFAISCRGENNKQIVTYLKMHSAQSLEHQSQNLLHLVAWEIMRIPP